MIADFAFAENLTVTENAARLLYGGAGKVILTNEIQQRFGVVDSETSAIVSLPGKIEDVLAWAIFVEQPEGYYRVRLRSKGPVINELAKRYHGGGHPLASGANAKDQAMCQDIYREIQVLCKNYNQDRLI